MTKKLSAHSNQRTLSLVETQQLHFITQFQPSQVEPKEIQDARVKIIRAVQTVIHLNQSGLTPIIDSFPYAFLKSKEKVA